MPLDQVKHIVRSDAHLAVSRDVAERSATLVKDTQNLLPLNTSKHRRICWISQGAPGFLPHLPNRQMDVLRQSLSERGFEITDYNPDAPPTPATTDLVIYVMAEESSLGKNPHFPELAHPSAGARQHDDALLARHAHAARVLRPSLLPAGRAAHANISSTPIPSSRTPNAP